MRDLDRKEYRMKKIRIGYEVFCNNKRFVEEVIERL